MYQAGRPPGVSLAPYRGAAAWACAHTPLLCAPLQAAERALAESPLNICGIPIKNLTMVEDRDAYYRTKHANTRAALIQVRGVQVQQQRGSEEGKRGRAGLRGWAVPAGAE